MKGSAFFGTLSINISIIEKYSSKKMYVLQRNARIMWPSNGIFWRVN